MAKTVTLVTNQFSCDRIIRAARTVADQTQTELLVVNIQDAEYELNPKAIDYLFGLSKNNNATMHLTFTKDRLGVIFDTIGRYDCSNVVTGMPSSNDSILYSLWKKHPNKSFYTVDTTGELIEVASNATVTA